VAFIFESPCKFLFPNFAHFLVFFKRFQKLLFGPLLQIFLFSKSTKLFDFSLAFTKFFWPLLPFFLPSNTIQNLKKNQIKNYPYRSLLISLRNSRFTTPQSPSMIVNVEGSPEKRRFNGDLYSGIEGRNNDVESPRIRRPKRRHWLFNWSTWTTELEFSEQFLRRFHWITQVCFWEFFVV
jgi:hypothetical protein